jgi:UMF1 family MFS transporter
MKYIKSNKGLLPYSFFDFANSSFTLIIHAYLFPLYFKNVLFKGDPKGDAVWGATFSMSVVLAAVVAPFIGRIADRRGRYPLFLTVSVLSFVTTFLLSFMVGGSLTFVIIAFIIANACFYLASNIYDSLLTLLVPEEGRARFSSFAWGFGYVGGILSLVGVYFIQNRVGIASSAPYIFVAAFYTLFGLISVLTLKKYVSGDVRESRITLVEMLKVLDKPRLLLLLGYWLIADVVSAIILFTAIYISNELKLSDQAIGIFMLATQFLAFPNTYLMARLSDKIGVAKTLYICILIWLVIIGMLVFRTNIYGLMLLSILTSLVIGTTQSLMRAQYSLYLERYRTSEIFGWYAIATESSSILAPLVFGLVAAVFASQRLAMGLLAFPLIAGIFFIQKAINLFGMKAQNTKG